jgi:hypothetical protein
MPSPILLKAQIELLRESRTNTCGIYNTVQDPELQELLQHATEIMTSVEFKLQVQLEKLQSPAASL